MRYLKLALHLLAALLVWSGYFAIQIPLILLGFVLVPLAASRGWYARRRSQNYPITVLAFPSWMWLYSNEENGIDGGSGDSPPMYPKSPLWWSIISWSALRNSVGNARWTFLGSGCDPRKREVFGWPSVRGPYLVREGWRYEGRFPWSRTRVFRIGWGFVAQGSSIIDKGIGFSFEPWNSI